MYTILNFVNLISSTSIPVEMANNLGNDEFESIIVSLYDSPKEAEKKAYENNISCKVIGVGLKNKLNFKKYLYLYKLFKSYSPMIIHTHHTFSGFLGRIFSNIDKNIKVITTIHTDIRYVANYQKLLRILTLNFADQIIYNSKNTMKSFKNWNKFLSKKIKQEIIYNGVDIKKIISNKNNFFLKSHYNLEKKFLIGTVGRLEEVKDQKTLIRAFNLFHKQVPNSKLVIVGSGTKEKFLKKLSVQLSIEDDVIFTGSLLRDEVYKIINNLDIFVISSKYEGFCNAMVEAMVAGNPIIASDIDPLPEVLGKNNGLFFKQGNEKDLAQQINSLFQNKKLRKKLSEKANQYAIKNYSLEKSINEYRNIYKELLVRSEVII